MKERKKLSTKWERITEYIIDAPELNPAAKNNTVLFNEGLETLLKSHSDKFDCVVISHIPLNIEGTDIQMVNNESRCWIRGEGVFGEDTLVTKDEMLGFLKSWVLLLREIHINKETLFLHPYFFDQCEFEEFSSPPLGWGTIETNYDGKKLSQNQLYVVENVTFEAEKGYHFSPGAVLYRREDIQSYWNHIRERIETTLESDAKRCLEIQVKGCHNLICNWLYKGTKFRQGRKPAIRSTSLYACPTAVLTRRSLSSQDYKSFNNSYQIAPGVAGMFWLNFVAKRSKWGKKEREAAHEILKTTWFLVLSDHLYRKQIADERRGKAEGMLAAAHDMSRMVSAIKHENPPEVLQLIQTYFKLLVDYLIDRSMDSNQRYSIELQELFNGAAIMAGRIEELILLTKGSPNIQLNEIERSDLWVEKKLKVSDVLKDIRINLTKRELSAFQLALTEVLRNTIRHTRKPESDVSSSENNFYIDVKICTENNLLIFENSILKRWASSIKEGIMTGTLGSLKTYARAYNQNDSLVELKRVSCEEILIDSATRFREKWRTSLPIPNYKKADDERL